MSTFPQEIISDTSVPPSAPSVPVPAGWRSTSGYNNIDDLMAAYPNQQPLWYQAMFYGPNGAPGSTGYQGKPAPLIPPQPIAPDPFVRPIPQPTPLPQLTPIQYPINPYPPSPLPSISPSPQPLLPPRSINDVNPFPQPTGTDSRSPSPNQNAYDNANPNANFNRPLGVQPQPYDPNAIRPPMGGDYMNSLLGNSGSVDQSDPRIIEMQKQLQQLTAQPQPLMSSAAQMQKQPNRNAYNNANPNAKFLRNQNGAGYGVLQDAYGNVGRPVDQYTTSIPTNQPPLMGTPTLVGTPTYGGGNFKPQPQGKGGQQPAQNNGDWQNRFQQVMGQNWPSQNQSNAQGKGGATQPTQPTQSGSGKGGAKQTYGSNKSWS